MSNKVLKHKEGVGVTASEAENLSVLDKFTSAATELGSDLSEKMGLDFESDENFGSNKNSQFDVKASGRKLIDHLDWGFILLLFTLISVGIVFEASSSVAIAEDRTGNPFYYLQKHLTFLAIGLFVALVMFQIPMKAWMVLSPWILFLGVTALTLVLIPGVGVRVNGSQRWLNFGFLSFQVSEFAKMGMILFLAGYLVRRGDELRAHWRGFSKPLVVLGLMLVLLLMEPDFGSSVVISGTVLALLFLAGIPLFRFILILSAGIGLLGYLATSTAYRMDRILAFLDPWADQFNTGYQLTQALIAFGRGEWLGVGLGNSLQKLFYLPEAHTDFIFAVIAEETGLIGASLLIVLLWVFGSKILGLGRCCVAAAEEHERPQMLYSGYVVLGIGIMFLLQCFINIGVSCGLLPTKGLTLPFISYGGSSLLIWCGCMALVLRASVELSMLQDQSVGSVRSGRGYRAEVLA